MEWTDKEYYGRVLKLLKKEVEDKKDYEVYWSGSSGIDLLYRPNKGPQ